MSQVDEIEEAIERLPTKEMLQVAEWLDEFRSMIRSSDDLFQRLDAEEVENPVSQWIGP